MASPSNEEKDTDMLLDDQDPDMLPEDQDADLHSEEPETDIDLLPVDKNVLESFPKNSTMRNTRWTLSRWNNWRSIFNPQLGDAEKIPSVAELLNLPYAKVDKLLARFITEIKRPNGDDFPFDSVKSVVFGIQRYAKVYANLYKEKPLIFLGEEYLFPEFNEAYRLRKHYVARNGVAVDRKKIPEGVNAYKEKALWEQRDFGIHSAEAFSDTIVFYLIKIFGMVSSFSLRALKIEHFVFSEDEHGKYVEIDKNYANGLYEQREAIFMRSRGIETISGKLRQYQDPYNPRTFYNLLMEYIAEMKDKTNDDNALLLIARRGSFSQQAVGRNALTRTLNKILNRANLKGYYTNLSFDQSVTHRLLASGYNTKRQRCFNIGEHLDICKMLDPPLGELTMSPKASPPVINSQTQFTSQIPAILQLGSMQGSNQLTAFVGNLPTSTGSKGLTFNILPPVLPTSTSTTAGSSSVTHVPAPAHTAPGYTVTTAQAHATTPAHTMTSVPAPAHASAPRFSVTTSLLSAPVSNTSCHAPVATAAKPSTTAHSRFQLQDQQSYAPLCLAKPNTRGHASLVQPNTRGHNSLVQPNTRGHDSVSAETSSVTSHVTVTKSEPMSPQNNVYPLFLSSASTTDNHNTTNFTIKQEPGEYDCGAETYDDVNKQISDSTETSENDSNQSFENAQTYNLRKRSLVTYESDNESATSDNNDNTSAKVMRQDGPCNSGDNAAAIVEAHNVDIEFVYSHNVDKKFLKQTVSVNDDDETVFSSTGSTRFGKPAGELELCLGDYLPEDAYVKVSDIKLKRVTTADGGKMIFQLKYMPGS